ncbi:MAG: LptA/OstA family protein [Prochloraceae cyanobacterium]|nr:LptA/OstA family protein [Prochloraceae cyanobacterium]
MSPSNRGSILGLFTFLGALILTIAVQLPRSVQVAAQNSDTGEITLLAEIQEADIERGILTARGNVRVFYPARDIKATAIQAQYFDRERRLILSGNVIVLQKGNSIRGEKVIYLVDEGRFIATPTGSGQVESTYIIRDPQATSQPTLPPTPEFNRN